MIRLLFIGIALYLAARILGGLFSTPAKKVEVKGDSKKDALDLSDEDVEDVDYKEIK
ncbi:hypothetical protein JXA70_09020 [candidate division KSB1 bacterium]|nr:hypothetical protein [candidate division KSB1 bacterium]